jgi:hypothetical protein
MLRYAQVHKKRGSKGKIEEITTRIVLGDEREILLLLLDANRCKTIHTVFVESRNGKFRNDGPLNPTDFVSFPKGCFSRCPH